MPETKNKTNKNYFEVLYDINVNEKVEKKNNLSYLSWAWAWSEVKKIHPDANYIIYDNPEGWNYHTDGRTCWVKTGVIINDIEHIEQLPVMDNRNASIKLNDVTSFSVNKAIQRSLTKACARHGLGLYIYAGEDLPETEAVENEKEALKNKEAQEALQAAIKKVVTAGSKLMALKVDRDTMYGVVSKHNNGDKDPSTITTIEVCEAVISEFKKLQESAKKDKTEKPKKPDNTKEAEPENTTNKVVEKKEIKK